MEERIYIASDNAAVAYKAAFVELLTQLGYTPVDLGVSLETDDTYYPYIAERLAREIQADPDRRRGVLLCGTGIGMCISANKFKGIRAAVVHDCFAGTRSRLSNDCNVFCLGSRVIGLESAKMLLTEWLSLGHAVESSRPKVNAISAIEGENFK
nr:RpiB/LacA/LacB family sugar-phosphate isomerase [uncultured Oscillibacter sp.]